MSSALEARLERLVEAVAPPKGRIVYTIDLRALARLGEPVPPPDGLDASNQARRRLKTGDGSLLVLTLWDERPALEAKAKAISEGQDESAESSPAL